MIRNIRVLAAVLVITLAALPFCNHYRAAALATSSPTTEQDFAPDPFGHLVMTATRTDVTLTLKTTTKTRRGEPINLYVDLRNGRKPGWGISFFSGEPFFHIKAYDDSGRPFPLRDRTPQRPHAENTVGASAGAELSETDDLRKIFDIPDRATVYVSVSCLIDTWSDENDESPTLDIDHVRIVAE